MAVKMVRFVILLFFLPALNPTMAQRLSNLKVAEANNSVLIRFTVSKGVDCGGFRVLHSLDSLNFNLVGEEPGICGNVAEDDVKTFTHISPVLHTNNYYRIELYTHELSPIVKIYVGQQSVKSLIVYPNPTSGNSGVIALKDRLAADAKLNGGIYDRFGKLARSINGLVPEPGNMIASTDGLAAGMYRVWLSDGKNIFSTYILVF